jgi:hypothetical protein
MDAPESITNEKVDGRDCTVVRFKDGLVKLIFADGECTFLVPENKKSNPQREDADA